ATSGLPSGMVPPAEAAAMGLKERAAATMAAGYRVYRVDSGILPSTGRGSGGALPGAAGSSVFDSRSRIRLIIQAVAQIREGVGRVGDRMIDQHQNIDFSESVDACSG